MPNTCHDEAILVVPRSSFFTADYPLWSGLSTTHLSRHIDTIYTHKQFLPRPLMEQDPSYKQIIPYLIFKHQDRYFLMQRSSTASESRLRNKFSLGIGGHVRYEDMGDSTDLITWAYREFCEEVHYEGSFNTHFWGIINSEATPVDQVHLGLILILEGDSEHISVKSELKSGQLIELAALKGSYYNQLENWSAIIVDALSLEKGKNIP